MKTLRRPALDPIFKTLTLSGESYCWFGFALLLTALNFLGVEVLPQQSGFLASMAVALLTLVFSKIIKATVRRRRPNVVLGNDINSSKTPSDASFPSSHTATTVSLFVMLILTHHPLAILIGFWSIGVSFSRFYLGVHFPTDIFGGIALGIITGLAYFYGNTVGLIPW